MLLTSNTKCFVSYSEFDACSYKTVNFLPFVDINCLKKTEEEGTEHERDREKMA